MNVEQLKVIHRFVQDNVLELLDAGYEKLIERVLAEERVKLANFSQYFSAEMIAASLRRNDKIPKDVAVAYQLVSQKLILGESIPDAIVNQLSHDPSYDLQNIAEIQYLFASCKHLPRRILNCMMVLRQMVLGMRPSIIDASSESYSALEYRKGHFPLDLDYFGPAPSGAEIISQVRFAIEYSVELYRDQQTDKAKLLQQTEPARIASDAILINIQEAEKYFTESDDPNKVSEILQELLEINPSDCYLLLSQARLYEYQEDYWRAFLSVEKILFHNPTHLEASYFKVILLVRLQRIFEAKNYMREISHLEKNDNAANMMKARAYIALGEYAHAAVQLSSIECMHYQNDKNYWLATIFLKMGKLERCYSLLANLQKENTHPKIFYTIARCCLKLGRADLSQNNQWAEKALAYSNRGIQASHSSQYRYKFYSQFAKIYFIKQQWQMSEAYLNLAISIKPTLYKNYILRARIKNKIFLRWDEAIPDLVHAIHFSMGDPYPIRLLCAVYLEQRQPDIALHLLEHVEYFGASLNVQLMKASALGMKGENRLALLQFWKIATQDQRFFSEALESEQIHDIYQSALFGYGVDEAYRLVALQSYSDTDNTIVTQFIDQYRLQPMNYRGK